MFNVICLETNELHTDDGVVMVYPDGASAAHVAQTLTQLFGKKHQPRRAAAVECWRTRERKRFDDGTYKRLSWDTDARWFWNAAMRDGKIKDHFAHASTEKESYIAYTESDEKGIADRQTRVKPGRYLTQFFSGWLTATDIADLAAEFDSDYEEIPLELAHTPDDIERVYLNGPSSCMSKSLSSYESEVHPTRVYGAGDLAIAYIKRDGNITARCLCWPEKKVHARIYGDETRIRKALAASGYTHGDDDDFYGARLLRIRHDGDVHVMPYLDVGSGADIVDKTYLVLARHGAIDGQRTDGLSEVVGEQCECCGDRYDPDSEGTYVDETESHYCDSCANEHTFYCEMLSEVCLTRNAVTLHDGTIWSQRMFERHGFTCDATGERYDSREEDYVVMSGTHQSECWSMDYFESHGFQCDDCGENFANDEKHERKNVDCTEDTCAGCAELAEELEPGEDIPSPKPQAGRDESPDQTELTLTLDSFTLVYLDAQKRVA